MSDPIEDLENFNREGLPVTPLAPSEVRRLGDRRRHRRNAAAAGVGVLAAAAAVAVPFALLAGGEDRSDRRGPVVRPTSTSSTPSTTAPDRVLLTSIPDRFPLLAGVQNDPEGATEPTVSPDGEGLGDLTLCRRQVWPAASVDRLAGADPALDYHYDRELLVFPSDAAATTALEAIRDALAACPSETTTDGAIPGEEFELLHTTYDQDISADETVTWTDAYADGSLGTQVFQFVRVGNAVAGTRVSSESTKDGVADQLPMVSGGSVELVEQLLIFADPTPD